MSHQAARGPVPRFEIGQRLDDTWATIGQRLGAFVLVAAAFAGLVTWPGLLVAQGAPADGAVIARDVDSWLLDLAVGLYGVVVQTLAGGVFFCIAYGEPSDALRRLPTYAGWTLRRILPFLVMGLLTNLLVGFGLVLLVVPGLWVLGAVSVVPVVVLVEDGGFGSLRRSLELTKGYRWPIVGFFALLFVAGALATVLMLIGIALVPPALLVFAVNFVLNLVVVLVCASTVVVYRRLRWIETAWAQA